jgi:hypothetical protein
MQSVLGFAYPASLVKQEAKTRTVARLTKSCFVNGTRMESKRGNSL